MPEVIVELLEEEDKVEDELEGDFPPCLVSIGQSTIPRLVNLNLHVIVGLVPISLDVGEV